MEAIVPTHVGVDRAQAFHLSMGIYRPHARGGGPLAGATPFRRAAIVPTHVGVDRAAAAVQKPGSIVPTHVGVDRDGRIGLDMAVPSSPRTWGWTVVGCQHMSCRQIVPTHVGVDRH